MDVRRGKSLNMPVSGICQGTLLNFVGLATVSGSFLGRVSWKEFFLASLFWLIHFFIIVHLGLLGIA